MHPLIVPGASMTEEQLYELLETLELSDDELRVLSSTMRSYIDLPMQLPHYFG